MPLPPRPPMTSKEAKRAHKKDPIKFKFTASQLRRAERADELEARRQDVEGKERKRKANRRQREEKEARDREAQQKLLQEGRISVEDTWGKVTASQPRLNAFFSRPISKPKGKATAIARTATETENEDEVLENNESAEPSPAKSQGSIEYDSQGDTLVDKTALDILNVEDELSDADLLKALSPTPRDLVADNKHGLPCLAPVSLQSKLSGPRSLISKESSTPKTSRQKLKSGVVMSKRKVEDMSANTSADLSNLADHFDDEFGPAPGYIAQPATTTPPTRNVRIFSDRTARFEHVSPPAHEITGDDSHDALEHYGRPPLRLASDPEVYAKSRFLVDHGKQPQPKVLDKTMTPEKYHALSKAEKLRSNPRTQQSALGDLESEDRDLTAAMNEREAIGNPPATPVLRHARLATHQPAGALNSSIFNDAARSVVGLRTATVLELPTTNPLTSDSNNAPKRTKTSHSTNPTAGGLPIKSEDDLTPARAPATIQPSQSFNSIDDADFLAAEEEAKAVSTQEALDMALEEVEASLEKKSKK
ncbi:uncharacterized protein AB675_8214 [Cyphellophora attinorum]|uniref:Uncharacterized protein n=1 Tax=Cyphellophora attinorum TaxID=1664694 RepID=A0A0N1NZT3_9EURO|nr:uncharacterized protein AB675_8214 [Phialophora attinorum]KPI41115.1 hypothetical protein AB675_8214 [Phialophora attinorum]